MTLIINCLSDMLPYILIGLPFVIITRIIYLKVKKIQVINWWYEIALLVFNLFLIGFLSQTILPSFNLEEKYTINIIKDSMTSFNLVPFKAILDSYYNIILNHDISYFFIKII